jgi:hypothetical protein
MEGRHFVNRLIRASVADIHHSFGLGSLRAGTQSKCSYPKTRKFQIKKSFFISRLRFYLDSVAIFAHAYYFNM